MTDTTIKLVAIDLDGTLLTSHHQVSPRTIEVIRRAADSGIHIVIATGRPRWSGYAFADQLGLKTPGVYLQGLTVYDKEGNLVHEQYMDPEIVRKVVDFCDARRYTVMLYNRDRSFAKERNPLTDRMMQYGESLPQFVETLADIPSQVIINKTVIVSENHADQIRHELAAELNGSATVFLSQANLVETLPLGASKGNGVRMVIEDLGIPVAQTMAIGDGENDIEMLQYVGLGVAMANATPHLKQVAKHITLSNDEDGVAAAIEQFALK